MVFHRACKQEESIAGFPSQLATNDFNFLRFSASVTSEWSLTQVFREESTQNRIELI